MHRPCSSISTRGVATGASGPRWAAGPAQRCGRPRAVACRWPARLRVAARWSPSTPLSAAMTARLRDGTQLAPASASGASKAVPSQPSKAPAALPPPAASRRARSCRRPVSPPVCAGPGVPGRLAMRAWGPNQAGPGSTASVVAARRRAGRRAERAFGHAPSVDLIQAVHSSNRRLEVGAVRAMRSGGVPPGRNLPCNCCAPLPVTTQ